MNGGNLAGGNPSRGRVENDFYATNPSSVLALLDKEQFKGNFLEPCVGMGHIADVIVNKCDISSFKFIDIDDRGYNGTIISDYLTHSFSEKYDSIVTNPPYSLAEGFVYKSMSLLREKGKLAMFLKIQFLEGIKRRKLFRDHPPKIVYVFSKRQQPMRNGKNYDENTGKKMSSTMCFAWFIWENGFKGDPVIKWI